MKFLFFFSFFTLFFIAQHRISAQTTQTIRGKVLDEVSKTPLIGANVFIENNGTPIGNQTDDNGEFRIENIPVGRQNLVVTYVGYENRRFDNLVVTAGKEVVMEIVMTENVSKMNEVVVSYDRKQDKTVTNTDLAVLSARSFNVDDTKRYAGSVGDPSRMAANFAGVSGANDSRNDIVVRGNSPSGLLWQLEGINIPNPNHYSALGTTGGPVSMLNNNVLGKSDFLTSAFPAPYGNALSSVFDLKLRDGNNQKYEYLGQVSINGFELGAEGPLGGKGKGSFLVNYRYSVTGLFKSLGFSATGAAVPNYQDLTVKLNMPVGKRDKVSFFGIFGASDIAFLGNDVDTLNGTAGSYADENQNTRVNFNTNITGLVYEHRWSDKTLGKLMLGVGTTKQVFDGDSISVVTRKAFASGQARFATQKYSAHYQLTHKFNAQSSLVSGIMSDLTTFDLLNKDFIKDGTIELVRVNQADNYLLTQFYSQFKYRQNDRLTYTVGVQGQHLNLNGSFAVMPRVGLKYRVGNSANLSFGYGLHAQTQNIYAYFVRTNLSPTNVTYTNKDLDFTKSHHFVVGYDWNFAPDWRLKAETYYQSIFNAPVEKSLSSYSALNSGANFGVENVDSLTNKGTGRNLGLELTLEKFFSKGFYTLVTASLFDSKYKGSDGVERNTAFNTNYVLNVLAGKDFVFGKTKNQTLSLALKVSAAGGARLTPIDKLASLAKGETVFQEDKAYSEQQTAYFRTDLRFAYRREFRKMTLEFAVDLQNVTNRQNVFTQNYNLRTQKIENTYQQAFFPVPLFRITF